jgi:hypothetical protein
MFQRITWSYIVEWEKKEEKNEEEIADKKIGRMKDNDLVNKSK